MLEKFLNEKDFLCQKLKNQYDSQCFVSILDGYSQNRFTTLRVNTQKDKDLEFVRQTLLDNGYEFEKTSIYKNALIITKDNEVKNKLFDLDILKNGNIYLQSLSSMLPALVLNPQNNTDILDMTAAPGGKTTLMANLAPLSRITACEKDKNRAEKLKYNINLQNAKNCFVMVRDSSQIEDYYKFDTILLDAPCSGTGTIQLENEKTYKNISQKLISNINQVQKKLLEKAINICKKNGYIVYSTCSILQEENENVILPFIKNGKVSVEPILDFKDLPTLPCKINGALTIMPTKYYEGFFVCKLKKL